LRYDETMNHILLVAAGGALGSVARYLTGLATLRWFGPGYPWGTLAVNIVGGLAIGVFAELIARRFDGSPELRMFIITGILGGFTTFSAFSLEVTAMAERGDYMAAIGYVLISVIISVAAVFAGLALVRGLL
jgi:CrcB protein